MKNELQVFVSRDKEGYYIADIPALHHCTTSGNTKEEVQHNIQEASQGVLETMVDYNLSIPVSLDKPIIYTFSYQDNLQKTAILI